MYVPQWPRNSSKRRNLGAAQVIAIFRAAMTTTINYPSTYPTFQDNDPFQRKEAERTMIRWSGVSATKRHQGWTYLNQYKSIINHYKSVYIHKSTINHYNQWDNMRHQESWVTSSTPCPGGTFLQYLDHICVTCAVTACHAQRQSAGDGLKFSEIVTSKMIKSCFFPSSYPTM